LVGEELFGENQTGYDAIKKEIVPFDGGPDGARDYRSNEHGATLIIRELCCCAHFFFLNGTGLKYRDTMCLGLDSIRRKQNGAQRRTTIIATGGCMIDF
jgi:hypothetical protein